MTNIYMMCPDSNSHIGGIKKLYDQVDILNKNGFSAYVLHSTQGFKCDWFPNNTRIVYKPVTVTPDDYLVFPEIDGSKIVTTAPGVKKVIFNQNSYYTFISYPLTNKEITIPYNHPDIAGVLVVSEDNKKYLEYVFPNMNVFRTHISIDFDKFSYQENKKKQICFMPRKNLADVIQVINILKLRGTFKDYNIVSIQNKTEEELINIYKESLIYLSFGYPEGSPAPPLEAMACGCIVIGYHGMGGREYVNSDYAFPIAHGDIIDFVKTTESVMNMWETQPEILNAKRQKTYDFISQTYTKETEESDILTFWNNIINANKNLVQEPEMIQNPV